MTKTTEAAWRRWQRLVERGYGRTTNIADQRRIDARIRQAKELYEQLLRAEKNR